MTNEELAKRIYSGQNELMGELYKQTYRFIYGFCKKAYGQSFERFQACGVELEDLTEEAFFALAEAVKAYNEKQGKYKLLTCLTYPLQKMCVVAAGCRTVTDRESPTFNHKSLDVPLKNAKDDDTITLMDTIIDDTANTEADTVEEMTLSEVFPTVKKLLENKPKRYNVLEMHYRDGISLSDIGKRYGYSRERIRQIKESALKQLRESKNKKLLSLRDEIIGGSYRSSGLGVFKRTNTSSVEWAVLKMENLSKLDIDE
mgnify:CR=1 FL=1